MTDMGRPLITFHEMAIITANVALTEPLSERGLDRLARVTAALTRLAVCEPAPHLIEKREDEGFRGRIITDLKHAQRSLGVRV